MLAPRNHGGREMVRAGHNVCYQFCFNGVGHGRFQDSDDGGGAGAFKASESNCFSDHAGIGMQGVLPETIGQDSRAWGIWTNVLGTEQASKNGTQPHYLKVIAINHTGVYLARFAKTEDGEVEFRKSTKLLDSLEPGSDVFDLGHGEGRIVRANAGGALPDIEQAFFFA